MRLAEERLSASIMIKSSIRLSLLEGMSAGPRKRLAAHILIDLNAYLSSLNLVTKGIAKLTLRYLHISFANCGWALPLNTDIYPCLPLFYFIDLAGNAYYYFSVGYSWFLTTTVPARF